MEHWGRGGRKSTCRKPREQGLLNIAGPTDMNSQRLC